MGIRFYCPQGHKLNVKEFQAGRRGICPFCGEKILIPTESSRPSSREERLARRARANAAVAAGTLEAATGLPTAADREILHHEAGGNGKSVSDAPAVVHSEAENLSGEKFVFHDASGVPSPSAALLAAVANAMPDPLAENEKVVWYVRPPTGGQFGPATPDIIRTWLAEGRISTDTLIWCEGWRDWLEAGGVFPQLNLPLADPLAALNLPVPMEAAIVPQRAATSATTISKRPPGLIWIIAGLGALTLLMIAGVIWFLLR